MIPRVRIAALPTPIEPLPRCTRRLSPPSSRLPALLVKRDDLTGLALGGNKTRKLEFVLAEALANGARTLITVGAAQSNHCRQTAALAARAGLDCILVLSGAGRAAFGQPAARPAVWRGNRLDQPRGDAKRRCSNLRRRLGCRPAPVPDPAGGIQRAGRAGIRGCFSDEAELKQTVARLCHEAADRIGEHSTISPEDIHVNAEFLGEGYGVLGAVEREAILLFARTEGLLLDPVYTGRAAAGLIALIRRGFFKPEETVLFWHTGGTPALFAGGYAPHILQG
jgi:1-aminocyclopropane-1-carboxylate deaminase/D-cysteine desulfhydrase-like pyridoxal-dependent ACC family enzyme